jgi:hypothetical protein
VKAEVIWDRQLVLPEASGQADVLVTLRWALLCCILFVLPNNKKFWEELIAYFLDTTWTAQKTTRPTVLLLLRVYSLTR